MATKRIASSTHASKAYKRVMPGAAPPGIPPDEREFVFATSHTLKLGRTGNARNAEPKELASLRQYYDVVKIWKTAVHYLQRSEIKTMSARRFDFDKQASFSDRIALICCESGFQAVDPWIFGVVPCLVGTNKIWTCMICLYVGESVSPDNIRSYSQSSRRILYRHINTSHHVNVAADLLRVSPESLRAILTCDVCHLPMNGARDDELSKHMKTNHPQVMKGSRPFEGETNEIEDDCEGRDLYEHRRIPVSLSSGRGTANSATEPCPTAGVVTRSAAPGVLAPRPHRPSLQREPYSQYFDDAPRDRVQGDTPTPGHLGPFSTTSTPPVWKVGQFVTLVSSPTNTASSWVSPSSSASATISSASQTSNTQTHGGSEPGNNRESTGPPSSLHIMNRLAPIDPRRAEQVRGQMSLPRLPALSRPFPPAILPRFTTPMSTEPVEFGKVLPQGAGRFTSQSPPAGQLKPPLFL